MCPTGWTKRKLFAERAFFNFHLMEFARAAGSVLEDSAITIGPVPASFGKGGHVCIRAGLSARTRGHFISMLAFEFDDYHWILSQSGSFPSAFSFRDTRTFLLALEHLESSSSSLALVLRSDCVDATRFAEPETMLQSLMTLRRKRRYYKNSIHRFSDSSYGNHVWLYKGILELSINYHYKITICESWSI